jgi:hypothetical protein
MPAPEPFRYVPENGIVKGDAFSTSFRLITLAVLIGSAYGIYELIASDKIAGDGVLTQLQNAGWFLVAWALLALTTWHVFSSRIQIDEQGLHQTWLWDKHMAFDDLALARIIRIRGLEWLVAPRFYVRTLLGKFAVFYVHDERVLSECEKLQSELKRFRGF